MFILLAPASISVSAAPDSQAHDLDARIDQHCEVRDEIALSCVLGHEFMITWFDKAEGMWPQ
jgi:hypothetical protein